MSLFMYCTQNMNEISSTKLYKRRVTSLRQFCQHFGIKILNSLAFLQLLFTSNNHHIQKLLKKLFKGTNLITQSITLSNISFLLYCFILTIKHTFFVVEPSSSYNELACKLSHIRGWHNKKKGTE